MKLEDIYKEFEELGLLPNVKKESVGKSELGQEIFAFTVGENKNDVVLVEGGLHAREYITALVCIELIKMYSKKKLDFQICFVPLANPDGVGLCLEADGFLANQERFEKLVEINNGSKDFSLWKANINAVDLNVNFDALWSLGKSNTFKPSSQNFVGPFPESESETRVLKNLAIKTQPILSLCFHSKGEVIYYGFEPLSKQHKKRDLFIAKQLQKISGYKPVKTHQSVGGFSDWVSLVLGIPALTIEVGNDKLIHPIGPEHLPKILNQTKHMILLSFEALKKYEAKKKV